MISRMARGLTLCCGVVAALLATGSESHALCGLFDGLFGCCGRTTYRPLFGGSPCGTTACSPCATSACSPCTRTVCNYMPQTCYRAECVSVPVTSYRCVQTCDPCTGCPTTAMQPVTSFMRQVRYVPYTSYRQVCQTVAAAPMAMHAPAIAAPVMAAPASGCCTPSTYAAPTTSYSIPATPGAMITTPAVPTTPMMPATQQPVISTPAPPMAVPDAHLHGSPSSNPSGSWTYDPAARTTRLPSVIKPRPVDEDNSRLVVPAVYASPAKSLDDSGWCAARR